MEIALSQELTTALMTSETIGVDLKVVTRYDPQRGPIHVLSSDVFEELAFESTVFSEVEKFVLNWTHFTNFKVNFDGVWIVGRMRELAVLICWCEKAGMLGIVGGVEIIHNPNWRIRFSVGDFNYPNDGFTVEAPIQVPKVYDKLTYIANLDKNKPPVEVLMKFETLQKEEMFAIAAMLSC